MCKHYVFVASAGAYKADNIEPMHFEGDERKSSAGALMHGSREKQHQQQQQQQQQRTAAAAAAAAAELVPAQHSGTLRQRHTGHGS
jgi:hypothetical protein